MQCTKAYIITILQSVAEWISFTYNIIICNIILFGQQHIVKYRYISLTSASFVTAMASLKVSNVPYTSSSSNMFCSCCLIAFVSNARPEFINNYYLHFWTSSDDINKSNISPKLPLKHRLLNFWRWSIPWRCHAFICFGDAKYDSREKQKIWKQ